MRHTSLMPLPSVCADNKRRNTSMMSSDQQTWARLHPIFLCWVTKVIWAQQHWTGMPANINNLCLYLSARKHMMCACVGWVGLGGGVCVWMGAYVCVHAYKYVWERETEKETVGGIALSNIGKRNIVCWKGNRLLGPLHNSLLMEQEGMCVSFEFSVYHFMQVYTLSLLCISVCYSRLRETNKWTWLCSLLQAAVGVTTM